MKLYFSIPGIFLLLLSTYSFGSLSTLAYDSLPLVQAALQQGANEHSILAAAGNPTHRMNTALTQGKCWDYTLHLKGNSSPFHVSFNQNGQLVNFGYDTCHSANKSITSNLPMKQIQSLLNLNN